MDWNNELLKKLLISIEERMASKHRDENEVKWTDKLITIGKDLKWFLKTEK